MKAVRSRRVSEVMEDITTFEEVFISLDHSSDIHRHGVEDHRRNRLNISRPKKKLYRKILKFFSKRPEDIGLLPVVLLCINTIVVIHQFSSQTMFLFAVQIKLAHNIVSMTPFYWTMIYEAPYKFCYRRVENFWRTLVQSCHLCKNLQ